MIEELLKVSIENLINERNNMKLVVRYIENILTEEKKEKVIKNNQDGF